MSSTGKRVAVLVPSGWEATDTFDAAQVLKGGWQTKYQIGLTDKMPKALRWLRTTKHEESGMTILWSVLPKGTPKPSGSVIYGINEPQGKSRTSHEVSTPDGRLRVQMNYGRSDLLAFNRTYRKICNSLRIE